MITDNSDARNVSNKAVGKFASSFVNKNSCDTSFVDGVTFSYNAGYRPESKTTRVFRPVRQVAAPSSRREYLINRSKRYDCCHEIGTRWIDRSALAMSVIPSNVTSRLVHCPADGHDVGSRRWPLAGHRWTELLAEPLRRRRDSPECPSVHITSHCWPVQFTSVFVLAWLASFDRRTHFIRNENEKQERNNKSDTIRRPPASSTCFPFFTLAAIAVTVAYSYRVGQKWTAIVSKQIVLTFVSIKLVLSDLNVIRGSTHARISYFRLFLNIILVNYSIYNVMPDAKLRH